MWSIIGGSVMRSGNGAAQHVGFISLAIQMGATMDDLLSYQYATHPELAAKPSDNTYVFAAREGHHKNKPRQLLTLGAYSPNIRKEAR